MKEPNDPFKDRASEDFIRDYVLLGIFSVLIVVVLFFGFVKNDAEFHRAEDVSSVTAMGPPPACPPAEIRASEGKEEKEAISQLSKWIADLEGEWAIEEFPAAGAEPDGETTARYLYHNSSFVGEIVVEKEKSNKFRAEIEWQC